VTEYWLVYPYEQAVHQFVLDQDSQKYQLIAMFSVDDKVTPTLFPELQIDLADVFAE
jgi:Uma2 family endonuclease